MKRTVVCGCVPAFLGAFDFGFLALAGPRVAAGVGAVGPAYPWLFSTSAFVYGAAVFPAAFCTRRVGFVRALSLGLLLAAVGAATLAAAPSLIVALAARAAFGAAGALATTSALALLASIPAERVRRTAFAALGGAVGGGFAVGALLASTPNWRAVLTGVAVVSVSLGMVATRLRAERAPRSQPPMRGSALLTAAVGLLAVGLSEGRGWAGATCLGAAGVIGAAGTWRARAWLPVSGTRLARVCVAGATVTASGVGATVLIGAGRTGALLGVFGLAALPGTWVAKRVAGSRGHTAALSVGLALQAVGLALVAQALTGTSQSLLLGAAIAVFGIGHVTANGAAAGAVAALAGSAMPAVGALLVAAQYVGGGVGPVLMSGVADRHGSTIGVLVAGGVALGGAAVVSSGGSRGTTDRGRVGWDRRRPGAVRSDETFTDQSGSAIPGTGVIE